MAISAIAFALTTLALVGIVGTFYRTGTVKIRGSFFRRSESPTGFWMGIAILALTTAFSAAMFLFCLSQWLGW